MSKPVVVFVFSREGSSTSTRYGGFARRLKKAGNFPDVDTLTVALENLIYSIDNDGARVVDAVSGFDLADAQFVYFKSWSALPNEAVALAYYLFARGVMFADSLVLSRGTSKLVTHFKQWAAGNRVPRTLYCRNSRIVLDALKKFDLGGTFIMKDAEGAKGRNNYLVAYGEVGSILQQDETVQYLFQEYISNEGDYRIGVYGEQPKFILKRVGNGTSHLNNTSAGGSGELVAISKAPRAALTLAKKAAIASELEFAGVDVMQDKVTRRWYVLEVNQGSQIVTGAHVTENTRLFNEGLALMLRDRIVRKRRKPRKLIGRRAIAKLPDLGIESVVAKVDTGAYSSTLHATATRIENGELVFDIVPEAFITTTSRQPITYRTRDYFVQKVRSSNGHLQERYSIRTKIVLDGMRFVGVITLSDRSMMGYPLLVGRKLLRSRFIVNVELDEHNEVEWRY